jgi:SNF2 family DNA or RNA helicase
MMILSPSPTPSAAPSLVSSSLLSRAHTEQYGAKTPNSGAKNAKDYWERKYRVLELQLQPGKKRKNGGHTEDHDRTKRRHATNGTAITQMAPDLIKAESADEDEPTVASAELDSISTQESGLNNIDKNEEMRLLKRNVNLDDPQAVHDFHQLHNSVMSFGDGKCNLVDGKWKLKGFGTSLYHHQVIGVSWMLSRELHPTAPKGGILADDMGLGKTVQILACMSQNQPARKSKALKTLIIAPKRLLCQWSNEIIRHCSNTKMGLVFTYAAKEAKSNSEWKQGTIMSVPFHGFSTTVAALTSPTPWSLLRLDGADFLSSLTNYHQLQQQLPPKDKLGQIEQLRSKGNPKWKDLLRKNTFSGSLFGIDWHRVVLDEAHAISNRDSKSIVILTLALCNSGLTPRYSASRACRLLIRRCSWILTGTPLSNETVGKCR